MRYLLVGSFIFFAFSCAFVAGSGKKLPLGCWRNSHEEDQPNVEEKCYRPCTFNFPAARGRNGFMMLKDGRIALTGPSRQDGVDTNWGSWTQIGPQELKLAFSKPGFTRLNWTTFKKGEIRIRLK